MKTFEFNATKDGRLVKVEIVVCSSYRSWTRRECGEITLDEDEWALFRLFLKAGRKSPLLKDGPFIRLDGE